ncbi:MAG: PKD domain-containing protein [Bacteroidota bacterium]
MKHLLKPIALFACLTALIACSKNDLPIAEEAQVVNPISDYTVTADANDGFTFHFKSLAKDFVKQEWRFGDDTLKTEANPSHTYLATGEYLVDLKTFSKTGGISHKYYQINIKPDSVLSLITNPTEVNGQLEFGVNIKSKLKSIEWTFNAISPVNSAVTTTKSTSFTPLQSFAFGSFNNFTVTATSEKGSKVTLSRNVTTGGIVTDITQSYVSFKSTNENTVQGPAEGSLKLIDGNTQTKFGFYSVFPVPQIATLEFPAPVAVKMYAIENGNDSESRRDPKEWYIEGSNDNLTWAEVDHQVLTVGFADYLTSIGQNSTRYFRFFYYPVANPKPYKFYRWRIVTLFGTAFQIMEFRLYK